MSDYLSRQAQSGSAHGSTAAAGPAPGKRTLVDSAASAAGAAGAAGAASAAGAAGAVQRQAAGPATAPVHEAAARGTATPGAALPHLDLIQSSFGRHDVASVRAHTGETAGAAADAMGARAYATGDHVVLGQGADLFTEAHEAAHVVQQRGGVQLAGGVGEAGDAYEQHADEAAALVTQGKSAEGLLDRMAGAGGGGGAAGAAGGAPGPVQRQGTGEAWPGGPTAARKSTTHPLASYIGWIQQVEARFGAQRAETLQRLRRLYYSSYTGGAGPKFDTVIANAPGAGGPPMTTADLPLDVINGLYETNAIVTPNGSLVDVSHILAGLDVHQQGVGLQASVGAARFDVNFEGVLTWAGDLASWFVEAKSAVKQREQQTGACLAPSAQVPILLGLVNNKVAKDDLLGDIDAQVMAEQFMTTTYTPPPVSPYGPAGPGTLMTTQNLPLSEMLQRYYGGEPTAAAAGSGATAGGGSASGGRGGAAAGGPTSRNRFHYFVAGARPRIPHTVVSQSPLQVALGSDAPTQIRQYIHNDARLFIDNGFFSSEPEDLTTYAGLLDEVNTRFVRFLTTGLASGDAPWP